MDESKRTHIREKNKRERDQEDGEDEGKRGDGRRGGEERKGKRRKEKNGERLVLALRLAPKARPRTKRGRRA